MKKTALFAIAVALSMPSFAAKQKVAAVQVADSASLVSASVKFGEMTGNPLGAAIVSGSIVNLPHVKIFGPGADGAAASYVFFAEKGKKGFEDDVDFAVVQKAPRSKKEFLKDFPGAKDKDGVITIDSDVFDGEAKVVFSKDGAYVAASEDADVAKAALADAAGLTAPMGGRAVKIFVFRDGVAGIERAFDEALRESGAAGDGLAVAAKRIIGEVESIEFALAVSDAGLDTGYEMSFKKGSSFIAQFPADRIESSELASLPATAFGAVACSAGFADVKEIASFFDTLAGFLAKNGIKEKVFSFGDKDGCGLLTVDIKALVACLTKDCKAFKCNAGSEKFLEECCKVFCSTNSVACAGKSRNDRPRFRAALAFAGKDSAISPMARYGKIFPESPAKKGTVYEVAALSYGSFTKEALAAYLASTPHKAFAAMLPPDSDGGIGICDWIDGDKIGGILRCSPDEVKNISMIVNVAMAISFADAQKSAQISCLVDDDDDDDDDNN